jgi:hypothetical protein
MKVDEKDDLTEDLTMEETVDTIGTVLARDDAEKLLADIHDQILTLTPAEFLYLVRIFYLSISDPDVIDEKYSKQFLQKISTAIPYRTIQNLAK